MTYVDPAMRREHRIVSRYNAQETAENRAYAEMLWTDLANAARDAFREKVEEALERGLISQERVERHMQDVVRELESKKQRNKNLCNVIPMPTPSHQ